MADTPVTPPDTPKQPWIKRNWQFIVWAMTTITSLIGAWFGGQHFVPVPPPEIVEIEKPILVENGVSHGEHSFGWLEDHDQIAVNLDPVKTLQFKATPAGKAIMGDEDIFLWRVVRKVNNKGPPWYPNINQGSVGCCVGAGSKHGCDVVQATAIASGQQFEWKPASVEVIYAGSRIEVGGGQIRGDGSVGQWAMQYLKDKGGIAPMEKIGRYDLTSYNAARARQWGSSGVPAEVKDVAKLHPVKGAALVTSSLDVKRSLQQGYPVAVCSSVGFNNRDGSVGTRDKDGFCTARGTWPHCMCLIGWRNGARAGAFCLNSWGDSAHGGPVWPEDAPVAGFWIDERTIDVMVKQGDSFSLSNVAGFPVRNPKPDWFVMNTNGQERFVQVRPPIKPLQDLFVTRAEFALSP